MEKVIKYDRAIYTALAIRRAVEAFQAHFDISILREAPDSVEVQFHHFKDDHIRQLIGEFNNYLVQLENQNGSKL